MAVSFMFIGLKVLINKKPLIVNSRWFLILILVGFIPQMINVLPLFEKQPILVLFISLIQALLFGFFFYTIKGVTLYGIDTDDFQHKFIVNLRSMGLEFEQSISTIEIKNPKLTMLFSIQQWLGTGQIRLKKNSDKQLFNKIISESNCKEIKYNKTFPIVYLALGIFMLATTCIMAYSISK